MDFTTDSTKLANGEMIPAGVLARAIFSWEETRFTKPNPEKGTRGGGAYLLGKLTIMDGPYAKRTIFHNLFNPEDMNNSEGARTMGMGQLVRMLESTGVFDPANPATYRSMSFTQAMEAIRSRQAQGGFVGIETGIQKGTGGYADKSSVRNFLSPNPKSDSFAKWKKMMEGDTGQPATARSALPAGSSFGGFAPPPANGFAPPTQAQARNPNTPPGWLGAGGDPGPEPRDEIPF